MTRVVSGAVICLALSTVMIAAATGLAVSSVLVTGAGPPSVSTSGGIPPAMLALYQQAATTCTGLSWSVLAAIGTVESGNGTSTLPGVHSGANPAGAEGPMQFEPSTFAQYDEPVPPGGAVPPDPYDPTDAVYAAARDLCANGANGGADLAGAVFAYNHSDSYVSDVLALARSYDQNVAMSSSDFPDVGLRRVDGAQARFLLAIARLDDADGRRPSLLPGWTVGHVLTHVARNADSHRRRALAAGRGALVEQYVGGYAGRAAEIEDGAGRPAQELRRDVRTTADALADTWRALPARAWDMPTRDVAGRERPLRLLLDRRWQELEVHVIDLDIGPTHRDWPDEFVADRLPVLRATMDERLPAGARAPDPGDLDERDELAWLFGRLTGPDLPVLSPWN